MTAVPARVPAGPIAAVPVFVARHLLLLRRSPDVIMLGLVQPVMFACLFAFVLGGAMGPPGDYAAYFLPGLLVQTAAFLGMGTTAAGLADELRGGAVERFATMPAGPVAPVLGRTVGDLARAAAVLMIMVGIGAALGLRAEAGPSRAVTGVMIMIATAWVFSWLGAAASLLTRSAEAAQYLTFVILFPLTFTSSAYVPVAGLPAWLRPAAEHNPITALADLVRSCFAPGPVDAAAGIVWLAALWALGLGVSLFQLRRRFRSGRRS